jgi:hypothetical protein
VSVRQGNSSHVIKELTSLLLIYSNPMKVSMTRKKEIVVGWEIGGGYNRSYESNTEMGSIGLGSLMVAKGKLFGNRKVSREL